MKPSPQKSALEKVRTAETEEFGAPSPGLTERVFGIQWSQHFPISIGTWGWKAELSHYEECAEFTSRHYTEAFLGEANSSPFLWKDLSPAKARYYREAGDFFKFSDGHRTFGVFAGTLSDWATYYLRHTLILPEYQGAGFYQGFFSHLVSILDQHGVARLEGDIAPSNQLHIHVFMKAGFLITGMNLTERWGAMLRMTRLNHLENESVFLKLFCHGKPKLHSTKGGTS